MLNPANLFRMMTEFIFILLGGQVDFGLMNQYLLGGIVVVAIFMVVARPVTVFVCALPDRRAQSARRRRCDGGNRTRRGAVSD